MRSSSPRRRTLGVYSLVALVVVVVLASASALWSCVETAFSDGQFACDPGGKAECPPGLLCAADGRCRTLPVAVTDAEVDSPITAEDVVDAGAPVDACSIATWTVLPEGRSPSAIAVADDGRLFVGGAAGDAGWFAELDPCDGATLREKTFDTAGGPLPVVQDMLVTSDEIVIGGVTNDTRAGMFARFARSTFESKDEKTFDGGGGLVGLDHIARTDDGSYVLGGAKDIFSGSMAGWLARVSPASIGCTTTSGVAVAGVLPSGGDKATLYASAALDDKVELRTIGAGCALGVLRSAPFPGATRGGPNSVVGDAASPVVVGAYGPKLDAGGYDWALVASIDGTALTIAPAIDPNPGRADVAQRAVVDGDQLYVAVLQNATFTGGTPTLFRYTLPLTTVSKPTLTTGVFGGQLVVFGAMKTSPPSLAGDDALFIAGPKPGTRSGGAITRCRKTTGCK